MGFKFESACGCSIGNIRKNNEDNFCFNGNCMEMINGGLDEVLHFKAHLIRHLGFGVFDGMGGESNGEEASYIAADTMKNRLAELEKSVVTAESFLAESCRLMNENVCLAASAHGGIRMGSTVAILFFLRGEVYVCNLGDSRAFLLRDKSLIQLTEDHTDKKLIESQGIVNRKPRLLQHLGISPDEMIIEPFISKVNLKRHDKYLICSDGLTDMLTNEEISAIMSETRDIKKCTKRLISRALENGGRDNVTVILNWVL